MRRPDLPIPLPPITFPPRPRPVDPPHPAPYLDPRETGHAITLKAANGLYVSAEYGGGLDPRVDPSALALTASRATVGGYERFVLVDNFDGTVSLQCWSGHYVTAEGGGGSFLRSDATEIGIWEKFTIVRGAGGVGFRCHDGVHFLSAVIDSPQRELNATRPELAAWETFTSDRMQTLPPPPTRADVCRVGCTFQGQRLYLRQVQREVGWFPAALGWLEDLFDRSDVYDLAAQTGDTHVNLTLSGQYIEHGQDYEHIPGFDFSKDLEKLRRRITEAIIAGVARGRPSGFCVLLMLAGDGNSRLDASGHPTGEYNDPVGWTYGIEWLRENFNRVWTALEGNGTDERPDLTPWIAACLGYDGVVPGVQPPALIDETILVIRKRIGPDRHCGIELSAGYCVYAGNEFNNWQTASGKCFDFILLEFPIPICASGNWDTQLPPQLPPAVPPGDPAGLRRPWDAVWQIVGRLVRPYHRPPEQPADDDPHPPFLLEGTPRGELYVILWEFDTYATVRGLPPHVTDARRAYLRTLTDHALVG